jgi:hypothetical protein
MSFTGLRPQVLGDEKGVDGLEIRDLPEVEIRDKEIVFNKIPTMVVVRASLSKAGHKYFSFMGEEGCEYLKSYVERARPTVKIRLF